VDERGITPSHIDIATETVDRKYKLEENAMKNNTPVSPKINNEPRKKPNTIKRRTNT
jgi:hypothetical protein